MAGPTPEAPKQQHRPAPGDLAQAVALIQQASAAAAVPPQPIAVKVDDGLNTQDAQLLLVRDADGLVRLMSPAQELRSMDTLARERRLATQVGPDRRQGTARHQSIGSFIDHLKRFRGEQTAVWGDASQRQLLGVFDYHEAGSDGRPRWGQHRAIYPCPLSPAWLAWGGEKGLVLNQDQFAELLDTRDVELVSGTFTGGAQQGRPAPSPAELVTLANQLEVSCSQKAQKVRDPTTQRVKLTFTEESGASGPNGVPVPAAFLIGIPIFNDGDPQEMEVRLRVSVDQGKAKFHLRIHTAEELLADAFTDLLGRVKEEAQVEVFIGTPEA